MLQYADLSFGGKIIVISATFAWNLTKFLLYHQKCITPQRYTYHHRSILSEKLERFWKRRSQRYLVRSVSKRVFRSINSRSVSTNSSTTNSNHRTTILRVDTSKGTNQPIKLSRISSLSFFRSKVTINNIKWTICT